MRTLRAGGRLVKAVVGLIMDLKIPRALGLTIPPTVLFRADQVIQ